MNGPGPPGDAHVTNPVTGRPPLVSIALVAGTALAFEVLLIRLFSIIQWHHFAYLVISLALLGVGASGTVATLARDALVPRVRRLMPWLLAAFAVSIWLCFHLAQRVPLNVEELLWDAAQLPYLALVYLLLAVPFFLSGLAVCLALVAWPASIPGLYSADLTGAGIGAVAVAAILVILPAGDALAVLSGTGFAACLVSVVELRSPGAGRAVVLALAGVVVVVLLPSGLVISPYKPLAQMLQTTGARIVDTRSGPLGAVAVVESPDIPLRHAPGLGLTARSAIPAQAALFVDADGMSAITDYSGDRSTLAYLDHMTSAAPYHVGTVRRAAILGAGTGAAVLQALYHQVPAVDAVELNPQVVDLVSTRSNLYGLASVTTTRADGRGFMAGTDASFDLVQLDLLESFSGSAGGLKALSESYLYTIEAMQTYLSRLEPDGFVAITRWTQIPPRELPRLVHTAAEALRARGADSPGAHMLVLRGWQTGTLLVKPSALSDPEIAAFRQYCRERSFDVVWYPGMNREEANRHNVLGEPYFHDTIAALLGKHEQKFLDSYKFDLTPATDDRPFFGHFMKWSSFPEIWSLRARGGAALLEWGYLVLVASLLQAVAMSLVLILLPLAWRWGKSRSGDDQGLRRRVAVYFGAIGLAFLFVEIAVLQKLILLLHHPLHASVTALSGFLVFAGLGSALTGRLTARGRHRRVVGAAVVGIWLAALALLGSFDALVRVLNTEPQLVRIAVAIVAIAPLALCMGVPFAAAMEALSASAPSLVPWAWAVNGCASVVSAVLAALLAVHFGFERVVGTALALYVVAALSLPVPRIGAR